MLLDTMNRDTEFLCHFLIFLIIKITLLQNGLSRVLQLFDAFSMRCTRSSISSGAISASSSVAIR